MTFREFKAWLEGYSYTINECPTKVQWEEIKKKMSEVNETTISSVNAKPPYNYGVQLCTSHQFPQPIYNNAVPSAWPNNSLYSSHTTI
jgi:hypothetical protein